MRIVVFGATGNIGRRVAQEALSRGHEVVGVVRDPAAVEPPDPRVRLVKGDATRADDVARVVKGADAVVSAISPRPNARGLPAPSLEANARALIEGLRAAGVKRVLYVGGASSLEVAPGQGAGRPAGFPEAYKAEAREGREALAVWRSEADGLDWTYLSPAAEIGPGERTGNVPHHRRPVPGRCGGEELHLVRGLRGRGAGRAGAPAARRPAVRRRVLMRLAQLAVIPSEARNIAGLVGLFPG